MRNTCNPISRFTATSLVWALISFNCLTLVSAAQGRGPTPRSGVTPQATAPSPMPAGVPDPPPGLSAGGVKRWIQLWQDVRRIEQMLKERGYADNQLNNMLAQRLDEIRRLMRDSK